MNHQQIKQLAEKYAKVREPLMAALELVGGTHSERDLLKGLESEAMQLWPGEKSGIVTEIIQYPQAKVCHFWLVGGEIKEILAMEPSIVDWAKSIGCSKVTAAGRRGWTRKLKHWKLQYVTITRDI